MSGGGIRPPIEVVLFDLGSTLFYENGPWEPLYRQADAELWKVLHRAGVNASPQDVYGSDGTLFHVYTGMRVDGTREVTIASVLDGLLRTKGIALDERTLREALRAMFAVTQTNWLVEDDALPTLDRLRSDGFRIGAVSNGSDDDNTQALVDKTGVRPYLEFLVSSAAFGRRKPDPAIFQAAIHHFGVQPGRAVMVGDSFEADVRGAHGVGMQAIWITRRVEKPLLEAAGEPPEAVVEALGEIPALIKRA